MTPLKKACFIVIVLTAYLICPFIAGKDVSLAQELREEKALEPPKLKEEKVLESPKLKEERALERPELKEGKVLEFPKLKKEVKPQRRIPLGAEQHIPEAKEAILAEPELIELKPVEEPKLIELKPVKEPKRIELKPIRFTPIREIKEVKFETTGYNGEPIIFSSRNIFRLIKLEEDIYSMGDYVTSHGIAGYDHETKLSYIDIIKIESEELISNTYIRLYFKKEPFSISMGSHYEITGIVGKIFSQDRIYLDEVVDLREISIDRERIIETCSSVVSDNLNIIITEPLENEELRNWMWEEYGISGLSENQVLDTLNNVTLVSIDYDFFDQIAKCAFCGNKIDTAKDFDVRIKLECLYNGDSDIVEKIVISFVKIRITQLGQIN